MVCLKLINFYNINIINIQMTNPAIQNDFSYYRRTLSRNKGVSIYIRV